MLNQSHTQTRVIPKLPIQQRKVECKKCNQKKWEYLKKLKNEIMCV